MSVKSCTGTLCIDAAWLQMARDKPINTAVMAGRGSRPTTLRDDTMKTLVVFYSRTGHTRMLAHRIAIAMNAEIEKIRDRAHRNGVRGYLRSGNDVSFGRRADILPLRKNPRAFDLVIVGTPVWRVSVSSPVRTYLLDHAADLRYLAFFCTSGGFGSRYVFREMEELCGRPAVATFARTERQLADADLGAAVDAFVAQLRDRRCASPAATAHRESARSASAQIETSKPNDARHD